MASENGLERAECLPGCESGKRLGGPFCLVRMMMEAQAAAGRDDQHFLVQLQLRGLPLSADGSLAACLQCGGGQSTGATNGAEDALPASEAVLAG